VVKHSAVLTMKDLADPAGTQAPLRTSPITTRRASTSTGPRRRETKVAGETPYAWATRATVRLDQEGVDAEVAVSIDLFFHTHG